VTDESPKILKNSSEEDAKNTETSNPDGFEQIDPAIRVLDSFLKHQKQSIKGIACIRDVGCAHPGFVPYLARIRCPKVRCVHPSK